MWLAQGWCSSCWLGWECSAAWQQLARSHASRRAAAAAVWGTHAVAASSRDVDIVMMSAACVDQSVLRCRLNMSDKRARLELPLLATCPPRELALLQASAGLGLAPCTCLRAASSGHTGRRSPPRGLSIDSRASISAPDIGIFSHALSFIRIPGTNRIAEYLCTAHKSF